jgi:hypothetical protein
MAQELFSNILDAMRDTMVRLSNADPLILALVAGGIVLGAYFLLRR